MNDCPSSVAAVLWLAVAVWLLSALAVVTGIPGNVVGAMLIAGHAAAAAEMLLGRHHRRDNRALASIRVPVVRPSARSRAPAQEKPFARRSFRVSTFHPPT